jgi:hypothetical protein
MIELANAPRPKPLPATTQPLAGQPAVAAVECERPVSPARVFPRVQSKPITAFGQRP